MNSKNCSLALPRPEPAKDWTGASKDCWLPGRCLPEKYESWIAVCGGLLGVVGFCLGRQSVAVSPPRHRRSGGSSCRPVTKFRSRKISLPVSSVRPAPREGMFGRGPVTIEISKTP